MSSGLNSERSEFRPDDTGELKERWRTYVQDRRLNVTAQREAIVEQFLRTRDHVSIDELLLKVRKRHPKVGYATVYRTLKLLAECGVASERRFGDGLSRYELADDASTHHDHLICIACGKIVEFEEPRIEELQDEIALRYGFEITSHKHEMYGTCPECRAARS